MQSNVNTRQVRAVTLKLPEIASYTFEKRLFSGKPGHLRTVLKYIPSIMEHALIWGTEFERVLSGVIKK